MYRYLLISAFSVVISACSSSNSSSRKTTPDSIPPPSLTDMQHSNSLSVNGSDTSDYGDSLDFEYIMYRENVGNGKAQRLVVTSEAQIIDINREFYGELTDETPIWRPIMPPLMTLVVTEGYVDLYITDTLTEWNYELLCDSIFFETGCDGIAFNANDRSVTFDNVILLDGDDDSNQIILNGTVTWREIDEQDPGFVYSRVQPDISGTEDGASPEDLLGVWDNTSDLGDLGIDEGYLVIKPSQVIHYDYQADSFDEGDNCYEKTEYEFAYLGNGVYNFNAPGTDVPSIQMLFETLSGDAINIKNFTQQEVITPADQAESDFVPICAGE